MRCLVASRNPGKLKDFRQYLTDLGIEPVSLDELGFTDEFDEAGPTFEENSREKALFYAFRTNLPTLADDGGIEIDALNGEPGVRSRRWLGRESTDEELVAECLKRLQGVPKEQRTARLRNVITVVFPPRYEPRQASSAIEGTIGESLTVPIMPGYPFRSLFFPASFSKPYSELTDAERARFYHRRKAFEQLIPTIESFLRDTRV